MFTLVPIFIFCVFALVIGTIVVNLVKKASEWSSNNAQPVQALGATVKTKRMDVSGGEKHSSTTYYATFELAGGERREFEVRGSEYGILAEGDMGELSCQGTRYLGFARSSAARSVSSRLDAPPGPNLVCGYCGTPNTPGVLKCASCGSAKLVAQPVGPPESVA